MTMTREEMVAFADSQKKFVRGLLAGPAHPCWDVTIRYEQAIDIIDQLLAEREWQPIETVPKDGTKVLLYRPLAQNSGDEQIAIKQSVNQNWHAWGSTVPEGCENVNYTTGSCYPTHWMPLPEAPNEG